MVELSQQHLKKISANGEKSKIDRYGPLNSLDQLPLWCYVFEWVCCQMKLDPKNCQQLPFFKNFLIFFNMSKNQVF